MLSLTFLSTRVQKNTKENESEHKKKNKKTLIRLAVLVSSLCTAVALFKEDLASLQRIATVCTIHCFYSWQINQNKIHLKTTNNNTKSFSNP